MSHLATVADPIGHALDAIARERRDRLLLLLFDFDGTLAELQRDPAGVYLRPSRRHLLERLARRPMVHIGIVSGRRVADVRARTSLAVPAYYAGLHGLEIEGEGMTFSHPQLEECAGLLQVLARSLTALTSDLPGTLVENKDVSIALHVRGAAPDVRQEAQRRFFRLATPQLESGVLRLMRGSSVFELLPNIAWNKGHAVLRIREDAERQRETKALPVYFGDDLTDEDAFRAIRDDGLSVIVGARPSEARFRLKNPAAVERLLKKIVDSRQ